MDRSILPSDAPRRLYGNEVTSLKLLHWWSQKCGISDKLLLLLWGSERNCPSTK